MLMGLGLDEIFGEITGGGTTSYFTDALGSTVALTDGSGTVTAQLTYEPYGNNTKTGSGDTPFRYTARDDDGTGLYYYRARYYHPGLGRFVAEDPIGLAGGPNLYAYVGGNPISRSDPLGLCAPDDWQCQMAAGQTDIAPPDDPCQEKCVEEVFGFGTYAGVGAGVSGLPTEPKPFVTPGSSPATSVASQAASEAFGNARLPTRAWAPTAAHPGAMTASVARFAGRWVPIAGWGLVGYDSYRFYRCMKKCREEENCAAK
jgi:RHS repeat-associated protein